MSRTLNTTVLHDGVVYDAGTPEADVDGADTITADVWDGEPDPKAAPFDPAKGGNEEDTLSYVGEDAERAKAMLTLEQAKGDRARKGVSEKLQAIVNGPAS